MRGATSGEPADTRSGLALPDRWTFRQDGAADGAHNMAVDLALLARAGREGVATLRVYEWARPTVSFGRNERVTGRFDARSLSAAGVDAVRRPTGGRALLHADEVTYSIAIPLAPSASWTDAYAAVNRRLLVALRSLGLDATLAGAAGSPAIRPDGPLCFDLPAPGEIVVGDAKLVGSAVWRDRAGYLQHGSIIVRDLQHQLQDAAAIPLPAPPAAAALSQLLPPGRCTRAAVAIALLNAFAGDERNESAGGVTDEGDQPSFLADVRRLAEGLRAPSWLWRR